VNLLLDHINRVFDGIEHRMESYMLLADMKTMRDALEWALFRIKTSRLGEGDYFDKAEQILKAERTLVLTPVVWANEDFDSFITDGDRLKLRHSDPGDQKRAEQHCVPLYLEDTE
jgi:hypothetical protein